MRLGERENAETEEILSHSVSVSVNKQVLNVL